MSFQINVRHMDFFFFYTILPNMVEEIRTHTANDKDFECYLERHLTLAEPRGPGGGGSSDCRIWEPGVAPTHTDMNTRTTQKPPHAHIPGSLQPASSLLWKGMPMPVCMKTISFFFLSKGEVITLEIATIKASGGISGIQAAVIMGVGWGMSAHG